MRTLRLSLLAALSWATLAAQSTVQTTRTVSAPQSQVETRTTMVDGKAVTERVTTTVVRETEASSKSYKAAIFVSNRAAKEYDAKIASLEDLISSQITDLGFNVLSREVVVDSLRKFDPATASKARPADSLDSQMTDNSSALRLAQNMGVDYIIQASITGVTNKDRHIDAYGVKSTIQERTLIVTYKVLDAAIGGSMTGDTVRVTSKAQQTVNAGTDNPSPIDELLDEAAQKITAGLKVRVDQNRIAMAAAKPNLVSINIVLETSDPKVIPVNATVAIDGVAVGTAPGRISVRPGLSKIRISCEGFKPYENTFSATDGQTLSVTLVMSEEGYKRWGETVVLNSNIKNTEKLVDGNVKVLEGVARNQYTQNEDSQIRRYTLIICLIVGLGTVLFIAFHFFRRGQERNKPPAQN